MAPYTEPTSRFCTTPACLQLAYDIRQNMAVKLDDIDPCTDFYEYACGNFENRNVPPFGGAVYTGLLAPIEDLSITLRRILENPYPGEKSWITVNWTDSQWNDDRENFAKVQGVYSACTNYTGRSIEGLKPLAEFVEAIAAQFPAEATKGKDGYDHSKAMGKTLTLFEHLGIQSTQNIHINQDMFDHTRNAIYFYPTFDASPIQSLTTDEALEAYNELAAGMLSLVHPAKLDQEKAKKLMESVLELEVALLTSYGVASKASAPLVADFSIFKPNLTVSQLHEIAPQFNFPRVVESLSGKKRDDVTLVVTGVDFFKNASQIISQTPPDVMQGYFIWKAMVALLLVSESPEVDAYYDRFNLITGADPKRVTPRWKSCVDVTHSGVPWMPFLSNSQVMIGASGMQWIMGRFFADEKWSAESGRHMKEIAEAIHAAVTERFKRQDWLSDKVKKAALEKLADVGLNVALPEKLEEIDPAYTKSLYSDIRITSSHFANAIQLARSTIKRNWAALDKGPSGTVFDQLMSIFEQNASMQGHKNGIAMNLGVLQTPIYDVSYPAYLVFGGIGSIVGHEITHGFDANGRRYTKEGDIKEWWDTHSLEGFSKRSQCFVEQYNKLTIKAPNGTDVHVDGELTITENVSDAGGVASSFEAWTKWQKEHGEDKALPGLDGFTHEQLFFIKWGQMWCNIIPQAVKVGLLSTDKHSPDDVRAMASLRNSEGFLNAFRCKQKKPTCELW